MSLEKFSLKWNDFHKNISTSLVNLREDTHFSDVTLISEDGQKLEVHKVILSSSSPVFMKMLQMNKHPQPMIYLRGFKATHLHSILDFMYLGVANIYHDDLDQFLALAEELQLNGLTRNSEDIEEHDSMQQTQPTSEVPSMKKTKFKIDESNTSEQNIKIEHESDSFYSQEITVNQTAVLMTTESTENKVFSKQGRSEDLVATIWSMISRNGNILTCTVCDKTFDKTLNKSANMHMKNHVESLHVDGVTYECNKCDKTFRSKNALHKHTFRHHK